MKTLAVIFPALFLLSTALFAQAPAAAPVYTKPSPSDAYVAANAGATFVKATASGLTFKHANGHFTLLSGPGLAYQQNGQWLPTRLQVGALSDGSGWALSGTAINVALTGGQGQDKNLSVTSGAVTFNLHAPQLAYGGADTFTFREGSTNWSLRVAEASVSIAATIAKRQGRNGGSHTFAYTAPGATLQTDTNGHLHAGGQVHMTRPLIVGADKKIYPVCTPWSSTPTTLSFSCDDTSLPDAAIPYVIDPTVSVGPDWAPSYFEYTAGGCCSQVTDWFSWMDSFQIANNLPDNSFVTNVSLNTGSMSWDIESDTGLAAASCSSYGNSFNPGPPVAWYVIGFQMTYTADAYTHGCIVSVSGADSMSVNVDYVPAITAPSGPWGATSVVTGTSYTYTTGYAQTGSGDTPQYQFNWGDGTNTGWLPVGTISASHTWTAVGTYNVTAQAQDPWDTVAIAVSNPLSVNVAPLIPVTVTTYPTGLSYTVDGAGYSASHTFQWAPGSQHTFNTTSPQQNGNGVQWGFSNWSDGTATQADTITVPSSAVTYTAIFNQISTPVVITTSSLGVGLTVLADGVSAPVPHTANWITGSVHTIGVTSPQTGTDGKVYNFASWSDGGAVTHSISVPSSGATYTASFIQQTGVTVNTSPAGLSLTVDGTPCTSPCLFQWPASSQHTISTTSTQGTGATQYLFSNWTDGGSVTHVVAPSSAATYTANFLTQYYLTTSANPAAGGTISPASGWYNSGQVVSLSAFANSGYPFVGFTGAIGGTTSPQNLAITGPENVIANFTALQSNVPITALPPSQTVAPGGLTAYTISVLNTAGFSGTVSLAVTGQPQGVTASFSPSTLNGAGSSTLSVATTGVLPLGNYPLTITASTASLTLTTMAFLTVAAPSPPAWISPATGSNLTTGPTTFAWDSGLGVSQYQLNLGSSPGASDIYFGNPNNSQYVNVSLPATSQPQTVYATLASLIAGVWQPQSVTYSLNAAAPGSVSSAVLGFNSGAYSVDNGGYASQPWNYCVTSVPGQCLNNNYDAGNINSCEVLQPEAPYGSIHDHYVTPQVTALGTPSSSHLKNAFDVVFTASSGAPHGPRYLLCKYGTQTLSLQDAVTVYDAPPHILHVTQYPPAYPGGPFYATLWGTRFGPEPGTVGTCIHDNSVSPSVCASTGDLQLTQANPDGTAPPTAPYAYWSDNQINVLLFPTATASGIYDLVIKSSTGENGDGFSANPVDYPQGQSNRGSVTVTPPPPVTVTMSRQSLTQFTATGSPLGGSFNYVAGCLSGSCPGPEPVISFSAGVTAQTNPSAAVLSNPTNPCTQQAPCPGTLAGITANYTLPDPVVFVTGTAQFNVATFGLSCYKSASQVDWGTAPDSCGTVTITVNHVPITYSGVASSTPAGLPAGSYCNAFLADLQLQGSATLADGTLVQYDPNSGYRVVSGFTAADGSYVQAGKTVARDLTVIPTRGVLVDINGFGNGLLANDTGTRIQGYRLDVYMGAGSGACVGTVPNSNIMAMSACNPGNQACPSNTTVGH